MYYPAKEIMLLDKKSINKVFFLKYKRYPTTYEIEYMEKTGEVKEVYKNILSYDAKLVKKKYKEKQREDEIKKLTAKKEYSKKANLKNKTKKQFLREQVLINYPISNQEIHISRDINKYIKPAIKTGQDIAYEKQVIKSNNERREKEVLGYHRRTNKPLDKYIETLLKKY